MNNINFNREELYWIERTADIESSMCLKKFCEIVSIPKSEISKKELDMLAKCSAELINTYTLLKELRLKLEGARNETK